MTFTTRTEAGLWVDVQRADLVRGLWKAPVRRQDSVTVGQYVSDWIDQHPTAKATTRELYRGLLRTCIEPTLGGVLLVDLAPDRIRSWYFDLGERLSAEAQKRHAALSARGRTPSTTSVSDGRSRQAQAYRLLRAAMNAALRDDLIEAQPCRITGAGTPRRTLERSTDLAQRLLTPGQVARVADAMPPRYRVLVLAAAWSGLRQGELLALTRADVDLKGSPQILHVRRRVRRADDGHIDIDVPKTISSARAVALPAPLAEELARHMNEFVAPEPTARVFPTSTGSIPARSNLNQTLRRAFAAAEVEPVRFHDLRHVAQVLAAEAGATMPELMARMGHTTPAAAQVYLHARRERDAVLAEALGAVMRKG